jgi:hypothetical protein
LERWRFRRVISVLAGAVDLPHPCDGSVIIEHLSEIDIPWAGV